MLMTTYKDTSNHAGGCGLCVALKNAENSRTNAACFETHLHDLDALIKSVVCANFPLTTAYLDENA